MKQSEHIVNVDSEGNFYCRAVDSFLNVRKEQCVCGRGCPFYVQTDANSPCICRYCDEPALFPPTEGLDERLYEAYAYAAKAHQGQYRKKTQTPYFAHIITTMNYAVELTQDTEVLQAAILHDTVEDTWVTFDDLRRMFGDRVARLVETETENKRRDMPAAQTWEIRKKETIAHLKNASSDAKMIVLADKTANLESIAREQHYLGVEIWEKFNQPDKAKQEWYFRAVREQLAEFYGTSVMQVYDQYLEILF